MDRAELPVHRNSTLNSFGSATAHALLFPQSRKPAQFRAPGATLLDQKADQGAHLVVLYRVNDVTLMPLLHDQPDPLQRGEMVGEGGGRHAKAGGQRASGQSRMSGSDQAAKQANTGGMAKGGKHRGGKG
jgi:hypothetical protein